MADKLIAANDGVEGENKIGSNFIKFSAMLFLLAATLRVLLFLSNPPANSFDNHFEPIYLIMQTGKIPAKGVCWQCYQPAVFYSISAFIGKNILGLGVNPAYLPKILQFLSCLYGILHLGVIYLILKKISLSPFSKTIAFVTACFLPQHIYISAMHSNDTISYLFVAICIYLFLIAIERKLPIPWIILLSIAITITIFTKYTAFVIVPTIMIPFVIMLFRRVIIPARRVVASMLISLLLPLSCLGFYIKSNIRDYGEALPWNTAMLNPVLTQPKAERINFFNFKPWIAMKRGILYPESLDSFWTMLYSRMWFDVEPKFLYLTDPDSIWWNHYFCWLRGEEPFPTSAKKFSFLTRFTGGGLIALGMIPLFLLFVGTSRIIFGKWSFWGKQIDAEAIKMQIFPALLICNLAGIIALTLRNPVYSSIKAAYILSALPAFVVLIACGVMLFEKSKIIKQILAGFFTVLSALVIVHVLHIVSSIGFLSR